MPCSLFTSACGLAKMGLLERAIDKVCPVDRYALLCSLFTSACGLAKVGLLERAIDEVCPVNRYALPCSLFTSACGLGFRLTASLRSADRLGLWPRQRLKQLLRFFNSLEIWVPLRLTWETPEPLGRSPFDGSAPNLRKNHPWTMLNNA